jgi:hypothetical protein
MLTLFRPHHKVFEFTWLKFKKKKLFKAFSEAIYNLKNEGGAEKRGEQNKNKEEKKYFKKTYRLYKF